MADDDDPYVRITDSGSIEVNAEVYWPEEIGPELLQKVIAGYRSRPSDDPERTHEVEIGLTEKEAAELAGRAEEAGIPVDEYVYRCMKLRGLLDNPDA